MENISKQIWSDTHTFDGTDHALLIANLCVSVTAKTKRIPPRPKYEKPDDTQWTNYNQALSTTPSQGMSELAEAIAKAAEHTRTKTARRARQPYVTNEIMEQIQQRVALPPEMIQERKRMACITKRLVREEKDRWKRAMLAEIQHQKHKWEGVTMVKKKWQPRQIRWVDNNGTAMDKSRMPEEAARH